MSRSCHRAMFSSDVRACPRTSLARPEMRSQSSGLRLWGIAEEPVCPSSKGSSTSRISVLCSPLISVANFSSELAMIASVVTNWAWRSRCTIWLEIGAASSPNLAQAIFSTSGVTVA
ncbi:hypothetical protein ES703_03255 [subsurface metagenome]